jgi:hypothetical protein
MAVMTESDRAYSSSGEETRALEMKKHIHTCQRWRSFNPHLLTTRNVRSSGGLDGFPALDGSGGRRDLFLLPFFFCIGEEV